MTTDRPGGYSESDLTVLRQLLPVFAVAAKATTMRAIGQGLLASYLGSDPATRVLAGTVHRGEVQSMSAVLFYADLRGFTGFADTLPGKEVIGLLDDCFDCMVRPVASRGGEILKFLGDGLLATFRSDDKPPAAVTAAALDAASEALALMQALAAKREGAGKPTPGLDIALHVGNVLYGNVGTDARLDFTVIGPAVNEAARSNSCANRSDTISWSRRPSPRPPAPMAGASCRSAGTRCAACVKRRNSSPWRRAGEADIDRAKVPHCVRDDTIFWSTLRAQQNCHPERSEGPLRGTRIDTT